MMNPTEQNNWNRSGPVETSNVVQAADSTDASKNGALHLVSDFLQSAAYSAVQKPIDGVTQLIDHVTNQHLQAFQIVDKPADENGFTKVGNVAGLMTDMAVAAFGLKGVNGALKLDAAMGSLPAWGQAAITGAETGTLLGLVTPVSDQGNFWVNKARNTAINAGTFATMSGASVAIGSKMGNSFIGRVSAGALSGAAAGTANVGLGDTLYGTAPTLDQAGDVASFTLMGGAFGAAGWAADKVSSDLSLEKQIERINAQNQAPLNEVSASSQETVPVVGQNTQEGVDFSGQKLERINLDKLSQAQTYQSVGDIMRGKYPDIKDVPLFGKAVVATGIDGFPIKAGTSDIIVLNADNQPIGAYSGYRDVMHQDGDSLIFRAQEPQNIVRAVPMAQPPEGSILRLDKTPVQPGDYLVQNRLGEQWADSPDHFGSQYWPVRTLHWWENQMAYDELPAKPVVTNWLQQHGFLPKQS